MRDDCPHPTDPSECLDDDSIAGFADRVLGPDQQRRVEAMIDRCATCRRQVSELIRARGEIGTLATEPRSQPMGRYQIRAVLGQGGMGTVLRAWDPKLEREVAIKVVRGETAEGAKRLVREARAMAKLRHPAVVTIYDADELDGAVCIVMEMIDGETLKAWFATRPSWQEVIARGIVAGGGLAAAHDAGLVHRDFKPDNVLCSRDGRVVVADFGLARTSPGIADAASALTSADAIVGTPAYMAPEQLLGMPIGPAVDQFAFATTLYEGLFGIRPFLGPSIPALIAAIVAGDPIPPRSSAVPGPVTSVVMRGLARDPEARWPSVRVMLDALANAAAPVAPRRARATTIVGIGGAILTAVVAVAAVTSRERGASRPFVAAPPDVGSGGTLLARSPLATLPDAAETTKAGAPIDASPAGSPSLGPANAHHRAAVPSLTLAPQPHFQFTTDRGAIDAAAHAWASDAMLVKMHADSVRADGSVDLAVATVTYVYVSPSRAASADPTLGRHCGFVVQIARGSVTTSEPVTECEVATPREPRCKITRLWEIMERAGADPAKPAEIAYVDSGTWEFVQGLTRHAVGDDCPRFAP